MFPFHCRRAADARAFLPLPALVFMLVLTTPHAPVTALAETRGSGAMHKPAQRDAGLERAIAAPYRGAKARARDKYRHPYRTLLFFGIEPAMTVVEIWPGGGWYSDILAPYLKERGSYIGASWARDTKNARIQAALKRYRAKFAGNPARYGKVVITELSRSKVDIAPAESADMVLTFRNVHNWMKFGFEDKVFEAMHRALKPGGILGIVEHRNDPEEFQDPQGLSGYVTEEAVIEMAKEAGFELVARSEINANPKDGHDHPKGVWTLPPSLRLGKKDRDKYLAIGESDRMTLKFVKKAR